jgi:hypothetical protein
MAEIGSSYIALADLIICVVFLTLFYCLTTLPPDSLSCRILAVVCGCIIIAIILVIPIADNLTGNGVLELAMVGIGLALGLFRWNDAKVKPRPAPVTDEKLLN